MNKPHCISYLLCFFFFIVAHGQLKPPFNSIESGKLDEVIAFVSEGGDVNTQESGGTLLMQAARHQQTEIVKYLLSEGADSMIRSKTGFTVIEQLNSYISRSGTNRMRMLESLKRMGHSDEFIKKQSGQYVVVKFPGDQHDLNAWTEIYNLILKHNEIVTENARLPMNQPKNAEPDHTAHPSIAEAIEESTFPKAKVPTEVTKETPREPYQWWLWLIGILTIIGGLAAVVRRKS